jgi:NAD-dependent SIR2 family protein deacetylase
MKLDVVFFGESVPAYSDRIGHGRSLEQVDAMLVVGLSLTV